MLSFLVVAGVSLHTAFAAETEQTKPDVSEEKSAVLVLTQDNFYQTIKAHEIVLVDFWATWCPPCQVQGPILEEFAKTVGKNVVVAKVNVDENENLVRALGVYQFPTLLVFKDGELKKGVSGLHKQKELQEIIDQVKKNETEASKKAG